MLAHHCPSAINRARLPPPPGGYKSQKYLEVVDIGDSTSRWSECCFETYLSLQRYVPKGPGVFLMNFVVFLSEDEAPKDTARG